jgi:hypothetical protein
MDRPLFAVFRKDFGARDRDDFFGATNKVVDPVA